MRFGKLALVLVSVGALALASGCSDDEDDGGSGGSGGTAGTGGTGGAGGGTGGTAGASTGGTAGASTGGTAGASTGGTAGASTGGSAGASSEAMVVDCATATIADTVDMTNALTFDPATITVNVGDVIKWDNGSALPHTSTSGTGGVTPAPDGKWDTGSVSGGGSACVQFLAAGTYDYYCTIHPTTMTGTVTVQ